MSGTAYVVLATELHKQENGTWEHGWYRADIKRYYRGDTVTDLSAADVERHLATGAIAPKSSAEAKAAKDEPPPEPADLEYVAPADQPGPVVAEASVVRAPDAEVAKPRNAATKAAWVDYAVSKGWDREAAEGLTRDKLRAQVK